jgi:hypothetical protein
MAKVKGKTAGLIGMIDRCELFPTTISSEPYSIILKPANFRFDVQ